MRYRFGEFELDTSSGRLLGAAGDVPLRPQALALLRTLIERAPALVSQDQILDAVWGDLVVSPNSVPQAVRELRKALGDSAQSPRYIETRHRLGYRLLPPIKRLSDEAVGLVPRAGSLPAAEAAPAARPAPSRLRPFLAAALLAVAAILLWQQQTATPPVVEAASDAWAAGEPVAVEALAAYRAAQRHHRQGDLATAEARLHAALRIEGPSLAVLAGLARVLADSGDWRGALEWVDEAEPLAQHPDIPRALRLRLAALRAELEGEHGRSRELTQTLFHLEPGDVDSGLRLVELQRQAGEFGAAERTLARLAQLPAPLRPQPRLDVAAARLRLDQGDADGVRQALAALSPGDSSESSAAAHILLAQAALLEGDVAAAEAHAAAAGRAAEQARRPALALEAGLILANLAREAGRLGPAEEAYLGLQAEAQLLGHLALADRVQRDLALLERLTDRGAEALARVDAALAIADQRGDLRSRLAALRTRGLLQQQAGQLQQAHVDMDAALALARRLELTPEQAALYNNIGLLLAVTQRDDEAIAAFEQALALFETLGDRRGEALAMSNLAALAQRRGHTQRATELNLRALSLFRELGMHANLARLQFNFGLAARARGDLGEATERIEEALDGFAASGSEAFRRQAVATLAELALMRGEVRRARELLETEPEHEDGDPLRRAALLVAKARLFVLHGDFERAETLLQRAHDLRQAAGYEVWRLVSLLDLAELAMLRGELAAAERMAAHAAADLATGGHARAKARALLLQAEARWREGRGSGHLSLLERAEDLLRQAPDSGLSLRHELLSALMPDTSLERLDLLSQRARTQGFELIALEADMAAVAGELVEDMRDVLAARELLGWAEVWLAFTPWREEEA
jgi:DNA-binding winged helix-turn-helix (wHTH) protein